MLRICRKENYLGRLIELAVAAAISMSNVKYRRIRERVNDEVVKSIGNQLVLVQYIFLL